MCQHELFTHPPMFPPVDTRNTAAVTQFVEEKYKAMYPGCSPQWLDRLFAEVVSFFTGAHPEYAACDVKYHDLEHTLQATVCMVFLIEGRHLAGLEPRVDARHFELAVSAALLHDTGYIRLRSDTQGTGAKYTFCHVVRSCAFAASYLPTLGADDYEVESVLGAISCTGPTTEMGRLRFRHPVERMIGSALATADFLGQMAASDYPDKLEVLYDEFRESDDFIRLPANRRVFQSPADLMERTPAFWEKFVRPKLETDFEGVYRYLARPYPTGPNPYLDAIDKNIATIRRRLAAAKSAPSSHAVA
jgi:hypothetical protein